MEPHESRLEAVWFLAGNTGDALYRRGRIRLGCENMEDFEELLRVHRAAIERSVKFRIPNLADAEDVLQEVYLTGYQKFSQLQNRETFKPWMLEIARNKCNDWFRAKAKSLELPLEGLEQKELTHGRFGFAERLEVRDTVARLGSREQQILYLYFWKELPQAEIAKRLGVPLGTVKSRLHTAKESFKAAYPHKNSWKGADTMKQMVKAMPEYKIEKLEKEPFAVKWEELMGWFLVPREGETLSWGIYDMPSRKLDTAYRMEVGGKAAVHGIEGVSVTARVTYSVDSPVGDPGNPDDLDFVAQLTDTHCRYLACARTVDGVRNYYTFLDGDSFLNNWGFGENNCGKEVNLTRKGDITRQGDTVTTADKDFLLDVVGRYRVTIGGKAYDTICVMDVETYNNGVVSEQFIDETGRTVLWRRFNRNDWGFDRFRKKWTELLPDNQRLTVNGETYVHWYDCITDHIL